MAKSKPRGLRSLNKREFSQIIVREFYRFLDVTKKYNPHAAEDLLSLAIDLLPVPNLEEGITIEQVLEEFQRRHGPFKTNPRRIRRIVRHRGARMKVRKKKTA